MCYRFLRTVCLLLVCLAACIACNAPLARGEDPPTYVVHEAEWEARIEAALDAKGEWEFRDMPFKEVCAAIQEKLGIDVVLKVTALEDIGFDTSTPITRSVRGISNRSALRLILNEVQLAYTVGSGALWITSWEDAEAGLFTRVYPVGDLLARDAEADDAPDYDYLIEAITTTISPDSWDEVGGPGAIEGIYETLVVSQTLDLHEEIEQLLTAYHDVVARDREGKQPREVVFMSGHEPTSSLHAALDKPFTGEFKDTELIKAVEVIAEAMNIPIVMDTRALDDFGIDTSTPVNAKFTKTPLRFALFRILNEVAMTYTIRDEVIMITTPEACEQKMEIRLYPVRDLVQLADALPIDRPGADCDYDSLIQVITSTIAPDSWDEVGGPGAIEPLFAAPTLLIAQTQDVHEETAELLAKLRAAKKVEAARPAANEVADPAALIVRLYPIYPQLYSPDDIAKLIMRASETGTWNDEAGTFVQDLGPSLVVKHNASGQRQVQKLLLQLGVWYRFPSNLREGQGLGGGAGLPADGAQPTMSGGGGGFF